MIHILAADIGATNSRFAHFSGTDSQSVTLHESKWFETQKMSSLRELLSAVTSSGLSLKPADADIVAIGVAGPIEQGGFSQPPYISWPIDLRNASVDFSIKRYVLINDFVAQAYACRSPLGKSAVVIKSGTSDPEGTVAVIGAGSNLGKAILVPDDGAFLALPSEGGHISFPPENERELDFVKFVLQEIGDTYLTCNNVISGKGIAFIHHFLTGEKLPPQEVTKRFGEDSETLIWASRFYGRICRNFALDTLSQGGLFIAGGVAAKVPLLVKHTAFLEEFERSPTHSKLLKKIPIYLMTNEESGLWGAAFCGMLKLGH